MPEYIVTISAEGQPVIDKAFASQNATLSARGAPLHRSLDEFLTWVVQWNFGITGEQIKATVQRDAYDAVAAKLASLPVASIAEVAKAVDAELAKNPKDDIGAIAP